jgi:hypothetical protein
MAAEWSEGSMGEWGVTAALYLLLGLVVISSDLSLKGDQGCGWAAEQSEVVERD